MFSHKTQALFATALVIAIFGCTDKDREVVRNPNGDGTDTFKFVPPKGIDSTASTSASAVPSPNEGSSKKAKTPTDGTETFDYKPDPRLLREPRDTRKDSDGVDSFVFDPNPNHFAKPEKKNRK
jgi:hypothetical protein